MAQSVGANRIVFGGDFTAPSGNPELPIEREKAYRRKIIEKGIEALMQDVSEPVIFTVDDEKGGGENA